MKIQEVIIVEGKNDTLNLKRFFDVDTIETHGLGLSKETIDYIKEINEKRGVIVFTDLKEDAKTKKKVGIEHATKEVLEKALENLITFNDEQKTLSYEDYLDMGLSGLNDSSLRRDKVIKKFHLGKCNGKTLYKRLNMLGLSKEEIWQELQ